MIEVDIDGLIRSWSWGITLSFTPADGDFVRSRQIVKDAVVRSGDLALISDDDDFAEAQICSDTVDTGAAAVVSITSSNEEISSTVMFETLVDELERLGWSGQVAPFVSATWVSDPIYPHSEHRHLNTISLYAEVRAARPYRPWRREHREALFNIVLSFIRGATEWTSCEFGVELIGLGAAFEVSRAELPLVVDYLYPQLGDLSGIGLRSRSVGSMAFRAAVLAHKGDLVLHAVGSAADVRAGVDDLARRISLSGDAVSSIASFENFVGSAAVPSAQMARGGDQPRLGDCPVPDVGPVMLLPHGWLDPDGLSGVLVEHFEVTSSEAGVLLVARDLDPWLALRGAEDSAASPVVDAVRTALRRALRDPSAST